MWLVAGALAIVVVAGLLIYGHVARVGWIGVSYKKFWDYLELLIVPAALALGVYWLNRAQQARDREAEEAQGERQRNAEEAQRSRELAVEKQRAQDTALQKYIDSMEKLMLDKNLRTSPEGSEVRILARSRTLTVLPTLNAFQKASVVRFLHEASLIEESKARIDKESGLIDRRNPVIDLLLADLSDADLSEVNLSEANLWGGNLSDANLSRAELTRADLLMANLIRADLLMANLTRADLTRADLTRADLRSAYLSQAHLPRANLSMAYLNGAYLSGANLSEVSLNGSNLSGANLSGSYLNGADLNGADLTKADLRSADLRGAHLLRANLSGANLSRAYLSGISEVAREELEQQVKSLEGATMPNGQKYEVWLKDREGCGEDGENSGP